VAAALETRERIRHPGAFPGSTGIDPQEALERFAHALRAAGGEVVHFSHRAEAQSWLRDFTSAFRSAAWPPGLPEALRPELPEVEPQRAELGVSEAVAAAAATGSLVLDSREGRRLQLLPPVHLVWVEARTLAPDLGSALEQARGLGALPAVLALHSGPSKSADIGRIVVTGVHGPGKLVVAVLEGETSGSRSA
jgi:L-lactate dehydrogenase complex protein LldG